MSPGAISHGRGEEKPKGPEQLEIAARGRSMRGELTTKVKIATTVAVMRSKVDGEELEGGGSRGFPHHVENYDPSQLLTSILIAGGAASAAAAHSRIEVVRLLKVRVHPLLRDLSQRIRDSTNNRNSSGDRGSPRSVPLRTLIRRV